MQRTDFYVKKGQTIMSRFTSFTRNLQQDLKIFLWFCLLFSFFRGIFIILFGTQLSAGILTPDTFSAMWLGLRLSLKTAGIMMLLGCLCATLPGLILRRWPADTARRWIGYIGTAFFTLLFCIRIPFYRIFNSGFNMMLINGKNDDFHAILMTAIHEYGLLWRLPLAIFCMVILCLILRKWLATPTLVINPGTRRKTAAYSVLLLAFLTAFFIFVRYGGAFSYNGSINWESAARLQSNLLNEAILDDGQALYRVHSIHKRMRKASRITFTAAELREKIRFLGGNPDAATIDEAFRHEITRTYLPEAPAQIVFILGETYAQWPFLPQYDPPGSYLVTEGRKFKNSGECMSTTYMLAHGTGTMPAIYGYTSGLADVGIYVNYAPETYREKYGTGIATNMKNLGYKTVFWYGGFGSWQDVEKFTLAQNFDEFHDAGDFPYTGGNAWGAPDGELFEAIRKYMEEHRGERTFHMIMTTSNHPPYDVNLNAAGFQPDKVAGHLPPSIPSDSKTLNELGHIWYADHVMGEFVEATQKEFPDTLYIMTGDHAERFSFAKEVDLQSLSSIPCLIYGKGIRKEWLRTPFGSSLQIAPTIVQLAGRKGQHYSSLVSGLLEPEPFAFNHRLWVDAEGLHLQNSSMPQALKNYIQTVRDISAWRIRKGNAIK